MQIGVLNFVISIQLIETRFRVIQNRIATSYDIELAHSVDHGV